MIIIIWNREFEYFKEQLLEEIMLKHKLEDGFSLGVK
jgi:hypothetical protein